MKILALDIGGSSVKQGLVDVAYGQVPALTVLPVLELPSRDFQVLEATVLSAVADCLRREPSIHQVGISTTGSVDRSGVVVSAGHFVGYANVSWEQTIRQDHPRVQRVITINDGRASAWAEYSASPSPTGSHIHAVVGTGIGGGIVHNGELLLGDSGQAGYIGHIKVTDRPTAKCSCGSMGCVETLAAAPAVIRYFAPGDAHTSFEDVLLAAHRANPAAHEAFATAGHWLGVGLGDAMNVLNPSVVSVGGGVVLGAETLGDGEGRNPYVLAVWEGIREAAHRRVAASADLRVAKYGNDAGLVGAALLAARAS